MKRKAFSDFTLGYVVKNHNDEITALIEDKEVLEILYQKGLPNCSYWDFLFDESMSIKDSYVIICTTLR